MAPGRDLTIGRWVAAAVGAAAFVALVGLDATAGTLRDGVVPRTIAWYLVAFGGFVLAVVTAERSWRSGRAIPWTWLWLVPVGFRVMLWFTEPSLSDDVYRYLWDGHLLTEGVNPYRHVVAAPELDGHAVPLRSLVNNPTHATPYLPAAEVLFAAVALLLPLQAASMQVVMTVFDLAVAWLIVALLGLARLPRHRVVLYLWNPLVIIETAHGAHLDAYMTALGLAAVVAAVSPTPADAGRAPIEPAAVALRLGWWWSPALLAAATLTRLVPVLFLAVLWWRWSRRQRVLFAVACAVPILAFTVGAGLGVGGSTETGVFGSSLAYARRWEFNAEVFNWVRAAVGETDGAVARTIVTAALTGVFVAVAVAARRRSAQPAARGAGGELDPIPLRADLRAMGALAMSYAVLTTTLHPWYLVIVMALLPFAAPGRRESSARWLLVVPWLYLAATVSLSYLTYLDPLAHSELAWARRVQWWPTLIALTTVGGLAAVGRIGRPEPAAATSATTLDTDGHAAARASALPGRQPG